MKTILRALGRSMMRSQFVSGALGSLARRGILTKVLASHLPILVPVMVKTHLPPAKPFGYKVVPGDAIGRLLFWYGPQAYEGETLPVFCELAARARLIADVGANVGLFTMAACASSAEAQVIAFEPVENTRRVLTENLAQNHWTDRCRISHCAVCETVGSATFHVPHAAVPDMASLNPEGHLGLKGDLITVPTTTLDAAIGADLERLDLVKIDVEGHEDKVLLGMPEILRVASPDIIVECNPEGPFQQVEDILVGYGYRFYHLRDEGAVPVEHIIPDPRSVTPRFRNFLCRPPGEAR